MSARPGVGEFFRSIPVNRFLRYRLRRCEDGEAEVSMPLREEYLQEGRAIQGGIVSALADTCAAYALVPSLGDGETMTGVEFKMNFLRPALLERGDLRARGRVVQRGRSLGIAQVEVHQDGRAVATGLFTFLFVPRTRGRRPPATPEEGGG